MGGLEESTGEGAAKVGGNASLTGAYKSSVPQAEFFRHFSGEGHRGFLQDIRVSIIDRLTGGNRIFFFFFFFSLQPLAHVFLRSLDIYYSS